jgi:hypothetical protein
MAENPNSEQPAPLENPRDAVRNPEILKLLIGKQMQALIQAGQNPDWLRFVCTDFWKKIRKDLTREEESIYELQWRANYKRAAIKAFINPMGIFKNVYALNYGAAVVVWESLKEARPDDFKALRPDPPEGKYASEDEIAQVMNRINQLIDAKEYPPGRKIIVINSNGKPHFITTDQDLDCRDWQDAILQGRAPGFRMVYDDTGETFQQAMGRDRIGSVIGSQNGTLYQRTEKGNLVNISKHPEKFDEALYLGRKASQKIENCQGHWNGEEAVCIKGSVVIGKSEKNTWWSANLIGQRRECIKVIYRGESFYIDDADGSGSRKVFEGKGGPEMPHKSIPVDDESTFKEENRG